MKNILAALVISASAFASTSAFAASCTCSDNANGGGNTSSVSNPGLTEEMCTGGRVQNYLQNVTGTQFGKETVCTFQR